LWGLVEEKIYQSKSSTLDELEQQIFYTFTALPLETLGNVRILPSSLQKCVPNAGACALK